MVCTLFSVRPRPQTIDDEEEGEWSLNAAWKFTHKAKARRSRPPNAVTNLPFPTMVVNRHGVLEIKLSLH